MNGNKQKMMRSRHCWQCAGLVRDETSCSLGDESERYPCRHAGRPVVKVNGQALVAFNFDYNNVLAWREEAGCSAWLQFLVLPGGPVFVGKISHSAHDGPSSPCEAVILISI